MSRHGREDGVFGHLFDPRVSWISRALAVNQRRQSLAAKFF
jgi:hypothetical protein